MNIRIYQADGTVKTIHDTRTPEQKERDLAELRQRMEDYYNRPENAELKRERDERHARMAENHAKMAEWNKWFDEQDRLERKRKKQHAIDVAKYREERDARDRRFFLKHLCLLPFYIVALPFILMYFFIKSCVKNGITNTLNEIADGIAGCFKMLPYILFPPLIFLEILDSL